MAKTETKSKFDFIKQINEKWKKEQQCYDEAKVEGKDQDLVRRYQLPGHVTSLLNKPCMNYGFKKYGPRYWQVL